ncbi:MAG: M14 family metallopeptidase, partial [Acidobacteria bacterium]|nr:M14 family metallopeptidase [Acidobacteriota bacterium]
DDPWVTPAELSHLTRTPRYRETVEWLGRLVEAAPELEMVPIGTSPEGRKVWMVIASRDLAFSPPAIRATGKPILLAQAGIHAGEIDGKDAGMMLLRDMTVRGTKRELLDQAIFLFVPIFNVDGHERFSAYSRMNQRGPIESGWRVTSRRLNLNRDYAKLDTPEMRGMVETLNRYDPDLYLDIHVTDGMDYQYDITFGFAGAHAYSPAISTWMDRYLVPAWNRDLERMGHVPGSLIFPRNQQNSEQGIVRWTPTQRYSDGYGNARHLPTVLVENHSLKTYEQRVLGTYLLLESGLRSLAKRGQRLRRAILRDRNRRPAEMVLDWSYRKEPTGILEFLGVKSRMFRSPISGNQVIEWTGEPVTMPVPVYEKSVPGVTVTRPAAYWIPPAWSEVIDRLAMHGIESERIPAAREIELERYVIEEVKLEADPFEGHMRVAGKFTLRKETIRLAPGSVRVSTDQPLGDLAVLLLEPESPDSFFQWGFFLESLQRVEYAEDYVLEPMARKMLEIDPALKTEFEQKLARDDDFAGDPAARMRWFYEKSPFFDPEWRIYPVAREPQSGGQALK